jgi:ferredoxin
MIKKVSIEPGCTTCGLCEFLAPDVFEVTDISHVKADASLQMNEAAIKEAAERCPVQVITYQDNDADTAKD